MILPMLWKEKYIHKEMIHAYAPSSSSCLSIVLILLHGVFYIYLCISYVLICLRNLELYSWPLSNTSLNCAGPLIHRFFFSINTTALYMYCLFLMVFFKNILFSLAYFIVRIQYLTHITYKICFNWLFMLVVRLPVNSSLSVITNLGGSQKLYMYFWLCRGQHP